jgi:homoserine O-acetyltransferase
MKRLLLWLSLALAPWAGAMAAWPAVTEGTATLPGFHFSDGSVQDLRLHFRTLGKPERDAAGHVTNAVLIMHGTGGSGAQFLRPEFAGALFNPGQLLDASKYFLILRDGIGHGQSAKPSDGLRAGFPHYGYEDMVQADYRLLTEVLGVDHLRLVMGTSMGGMHTWLWGMQYPDFMDILVPMASLPSAMSGRNWMMRRLIIDAIRNDPEWMNGNYTQQPRSLQWASVFYATGTSGGNQGLQRLAPTREKADQLLNQRLTTSIKADANDNLYQWDASRDYDPLAQIGKIKATLLAINSADDERNPPELGVMEKALPQIPNARLLLIPGSEQTAGHGTTGQAKWWKQEVAALMQSAPRKAP